MSSLVLEHDASSSLEADIIHQLVYGPSISYFFCSVNVSVGLEDERMMTSGLHTVCDVFCVCCGSIVGWKYEVAHEKTQKYKEGKIVLERFKLTGPDGSRYWLTQDTSISGSDPDDV
ncbi:hypothetical protein ZIOFF_036899 [Zingiber officinale]|uniref:Protein yippee-like n=1 Tax=Zingiber officinale TaxID=94328 RepID=A0A8J5L8H2_ZINOF|nr:hypothetical protein ZIOFF_036899 [Zingiber officinale]